MKFLKISIKPLVAMFVAAIVPAVSSQLVLYLGFNQRVYFENVIIAFFVTSAHVIVFGLPVALMMSREARARASLAIIVGFIAVIPVGLLIGSFDMRPVYSPQPAYTVPLRILLVILSLGSISATGALSAWYVMKKL
jgi:hypothetical protein